MDQRTRVAAFACTTILWLTVLSTVSCDRSPPEAPKPLTAQGPAAAQRDPFAMPDSSTRGTATTAATDSLPPINLPKLDPEAAARLSAAAASYTELDAKRTALRGELRTAHQDAEDTAVQADAAKARYERDHASLARFGAQANREMTTLIETERRHAQALAASLPEKRRRADAADAADAALLAQMDALRPAYEQQLAYRKTSGKTAPTATLAASP